MFFKIKNHVELQLALEGLSRFLLERAVSEERVFDSKLVACELVGNVLKHAEGVAELRGEIKDGFLELKIVSEKVFAFPEKVLCSDVYSEHGRGLFLVKQICNERIYSDTDGIKVLIELI